MLSSSFMLRLASCLVLAPITIAAIIYGGLFFQMLLALAFGLSVKEWVRMARKGKRAIRDSILGISYLVLCFCAFMKLRLDFDQGLFLTICLLVGVWSSDVFAYFSGKFIGGPKLALKISPNKTWAGLMGGMSGSALMLMLLNKYAAPLGELVSMDWRSFTTLSTALIVGALFTIVGQTGDLLISSYKRKVGVKDTGSLIPGHGGILDRIDSVLLVTLFFLVAVLGIF